MSTTFAKLGIPFPLFEAPVEQAHEFSGIQHCSFCKRGGENCFHLDIGCDVIVACDNCSAVTGLDANDRLNGTCTQCKSIVSFPFVENEVFYICYECLRSGKAAITKDTELGMISWEQAVEGITHGLPILKSSDFELVQRSDGWMGARVPRRLMLELLRTPTYISIQGDKWQFCCSSPMVYVGAWTRAEFSQQALDGDGQRLFNEIVQHVVPGLWEDKLHDETGIYVFKCLSCKRITAHWDLA